MGLPEIAAFEFGERGSVGAKFSPLVCREAAAIGSSGLAPGAGIKGGARGFLRRYRRRRRTGGHMRNHFFGGGIVDGNISPEELLTHCR